MSEISSTLALLLLLTDSVSQQSFCFEQEEFGRTRARTREGAREPAASGKANSREILEAARGIPPGTMHGAVSKPGTYLSRWRYAQDPRT